MLCPDETGLIKKKLGLIGGLIVVARFNAMTFDEYLTFAITQAVQDIYGFFLDSRRFSRSLKTAIDCSKLTTSQLTDEKAFFETIHFNFVRFGWLYLILWLPAIIYYFLWHLSLFLFLIVLLAILFTTTYLMWGPLSKRWA